MEVFQRANQYHLLHSLLLGIAPISRRPNLTGTLALAGVGLFAGSCYAGDTLSKPSVLNVRECGIW